jgi:hypothetical protein
MRDFFGDVFRALIELVGPVSSIVLGIWFCAVFWSGFEITVWLPIPFTGMSVSPTAVRYLLLLLYMAVQTLLVIALYWGQVRDTQTLGRNLIELLFSLFPFAVLVYAFYIKQTGGFPVWKQGETDLLFAGLAPVILDLVLTWFTATNPARRRSTTP